MQSKVEVAISVKICSGLKQFCPKLLNARQRVRTARTGARATNNGESELLSSLLRLVLRDSPDAGA